MEEKCRLCLSMSLETVVFSITAQYLDEYNIVEIVFQLTSLQIDVDDILPKSICKLCADKLIDFHLFRQQILDSQQQLTIKTEPLDESRLKGENEITFVDVKEEYTTPVDVIQPSNSVETVLNVPVSSAQVSDRTNERKTKKKAPVAVFPKAKKSEQKNVEPEVGTSETAKKKYICDQCGRAFRFPSRFIAHYRNVHLKQYERRICPYCPRAFTLSSSSNSNLRRHIRNVHENGPKEGNKYPTIKCTECDSVFWGPLEMYEHSKIHDTNTKDRDDGYNLNCDICNIDLVVYDAFASHMRETHDLANKKDIKPVRCRWCGERCKSLQGLYTHIRLVHKCEGGILNTVATSDMINMMPLEKATSFLCTICGKVLGSSISYKNHMTVHSGVKPFSCDVCAATFSQKFYLNNHKLTHSQERRYSCSECKKAFRQSAHLKSHLKTHGIGIKEKYACSVCNKEFLFRGTLREHMWVHKEGEVMPHVCECGKGFLWKNKLESHLKKGSCK